MNEILKAIQHAGGRPLRVGGVVRDKILGIPNKDVDVEVFGLSSADLGKVLRKFGKVSLVGESFGVLKLQCGDDEYDFTLPRRDNKQGRGHKEFTVEVDHTMTPKEAAKRRDYTINAISQELDGSIVDPFKGADDLHKGVLRATSEHFAEDPLRVLRGMQFAARFLMEVEKDTAEMCRSLRSEYDTLAVERIWGEFEKLVVKGKKPSLGIKFLQDTGWLVLFPGLANLEGVLQDSEWHFIDDAFIHTGLVADAAVEIAEREKLEDEDRAVLVLSALCHDLGKAETTAKNEAGRWVAPGHAEAGVPLAKVFLEQIGCLERITERVLPLVQEHMIHVTSDITDRTVRRLSVRLGNASIRELMLLIEADHSGRPPLPGGLPEAAKEIGVIAERLAVQASKPQPIVMGRHLIDRGHEPGPQFGVALGNAYEAQLDGQFSDLEQGLKFVEALL